MRYGLNGLNGMLSGLAVDRGVLGDIDIDNEDAMLGATDLWSSVVGAGTSAADTAAQEAQKTPAQQDSDAVRIAQIQAEVAQIQAEAATTQSVIGGLSQILGTGIQSGFALAAQQSRPAYPAYATTAMAPKPAKSSVGLIIGGVLVLGLIVGLVVWVAADED